MWCRDAYHPSWLYHFHLLLASICLTHEGEVGKALAALRDAEALAVKRGDEEMKAAIKVSGLGMLMGAGEWAMAARWTDEVAELLGISSTETEEDKANAAKDKGNAKDGEGMELDKSGTVEDGKERTAVGRQLRICALIRYCVYHTHVGNLKTAREKLKELHQMLDHGAMVEGEPEGWCRASVIQVFHNPDRCLTLYADKGTHQAASTNISPIIPHPSRSCGGDLFHPLYTLSTNTRSIRRTVTRPFCFRHLVHDAQILALYSGVSDQQHRLSRWSRQKVRSHRIPRWYGTCSAN